LFWDMRKIKDLFEVFEVVEENEGLLRILEDFV
jgi:hypothetical protein